MNTVTPIPAYARKRILLIDGGSRQVLPMIKGFHNLGCYVTVYCNSKLDVGYVYKYSSCKIKRTFDPLNVEKTTEEITREIQTGKYDLVIPMNDFAAFILSKNKSNLCRYAKIYVNDWDVYELAYDKMKTMRICMENQIPCPRTALIDTLSSFDDSEWRYPLAIKPRSSYGANGFSVVGNYNELVQHFEQTEKKFGPSLIQEYIEQNDKQYQVEIMMTPNGECKACVVMDKVRWYPLNGGSSTMNISIHDEEIKQNCIKLLQKIHWHGYASLDLIRDKRDGKAKILEINPRINGTAKICFALGIDLCHMILEECFSNKITEYLQYEDGFGLRYFHMDCLWFLKSKNRFKASPSWFRWKNTVDEIIELDDLKPAIVYSITAFKKLIADKKKRGIQ